MISSTGFKENFLGISGLNHEWTRIDTKVENLKEPRIARMVTDPSLPITEILNQENRNLGNGISEIKGRAATVAASASGDQRFSMHEALCSFLCFLISHSERNLCKSGARERSRWEANDTDGRPNGRVSGSERVKSADDEHFCASFVISVVLWRGVAR